MRLPELCIKYPVFAIVINLLIIVAGFLAYQHIPLETFPPHDRPVVTVRINYTGASASFMEKEVTNPLEQALSLVPNIDNIRSTSEKGTSQIKIYIISSANPYQVENQIRDAVSDARNTLPENIEPPTISVASSNDELMELAVNDPNMPLANIRDYIKQYVLANFFSIPGIAYVDVWGVGQFAMRIWLNPVAMAAKNISANAVITAVQNNNVSLPGGEIKSITMNYPISLNTKLQTAKQFSNILLTKTNGTATYLKDVAQVKLGTQEEEHSISFNGIKSVYMNVLPQPNSNEINAYHKVNKMLTDLEKKLPHGMKISETFNLIGYLLSSIHEVLLSIGLAILCVLLVIFLFLGDIRSIMIPFVTIPISLIGSLIFMAIFKLSLNLFTLLAIVLAVGLVVDDAIVMLENIHRHLEKNPDRIQASIAASREIAYPIIIMTLTLVAVYAPMAFMQDHFAAFFQQFAITLAAAVLISGFCSLTLSPYMSSRILKSTNQEHGLKKIIYLTFEKLKKYYKHALVWFFKRWIIMPIILLAIIILGYFVYGWLPKTIVPQENIGIIKTFIETPTGSNLAYTTTYSKTISNIIKKQLPQGNIFTIVGNPNTNNAIIVYDFPKGAQNKINIAAVLKRLNASYQKIPGVKAYASAISFFGGGKKDLELAITTTGDYKSLNTTMNKVMDKLNTDPALKNVSQDMNFDSRQFSITINHNKANDIGVSNSTINQTLSTIFGSTHTTDFQYNNNNYPVIIQAEPQYRQSINNINKINILTDNGVTVPLSSLITVKPIVSQTTLSHYNRLRSSIISAQLSPGYDLGHVMKNLAQALPQWLPENDSFTPLGKAKLFVESSSSSVATFVLAIVFIYLILAVQFGSFIDPFIVLLTIPLCIVGAMSVLYLIGGSINLYTSIALITLVGIITKHGILITQFANQLRKQGYDAATAAIEAAQIRLRPILMTTAAMVFGTLPLALAFGSGAASRQQIGWTIIGGLLFGTFFSLFVIPVVYSLVSRKNATDSIN